MAKIADHLRTFLRNNSLSLVFLLLFIASIIAQTITGWNVYNEQLVEENVASIPFNQYLVSGHFLSATFENFESEFLQMALYIILTIRLRQIGSAESKSLDKKEEVDREPRAVADAPWPVKKGGWILRLYTHSLSIAFIILFLISWTMHLIGSWKDQNFENLIKDQPFLTFTEFLIKPRFWFETFQNWQSEFLSVFSIVVLSIFLRQKGSPESKPVDAAHMATGKI